MARKPKAMVRAGVERDLADLRLRDPALAESGLAATCLTLADEIDHPGNSATSKSMCARVLTDAMAQLRALAPAKPQRDKLDDLTSRRAARSTGRSRAPA